MFILFGIVVKGRERINEISIHWERRIRKGEKNNKKKIKVLPYLDTENLPYKLRVEIKFRCSLAEESMDPVLSRSPVDGYLDLSRKQARQLRDALVRADLK